MGLKATNLFRFDQHATGNFDKPQLYRRHHVLFN